jgi:quercetin dioxygenase-like cupin family protein
LKKARLARHESLATVAAATGISKSSLSLIENDRADIPLDLHLLASDRNRAMMPIVGVIAPGGGGDFAKHEGEELVVVLEGELLLELEGTAPVVLERGDCAYYQSTQPHRWTNSGDSLARVLSVSTPPRW